MDFTLSILIGIIVLFFALTVYTIKRRQRKRPKTFLVEDYLPHPSEEEKKDGFLIAVVVKHWDHDYPIKTEYWAEGIPSAKKIIENLRVRHYDTSTWWKKFRTRWAPEIFVTVYRYKRTTVELPGMQWCFKPKFVTSYEKIS